MKSNLMIYCHVNVQNLSYIDMYFSNDWQGEMLKVAKTMEMNNHDAGY